VHNSEASSGIGTMSPAAKLDIDTGANNDLLVGKDSASANYNTVSLNGSLGDPGSLGLTGGASGDANLYINAPTSGSLVLRPNSATGGNNSASTVTVSGSQTIFQNGNVGIGISTPGQALSVSGSGYFTGDLGIGTTSAPYPLTVQSSSGVGTLQLLGNGDGFSYSSLLFENLAQAGWQMNFRKADNNDLEWFYQTSPSNQNAASLALATNGNVGIGTTSPDALLTVGSATPSGNVAHFENSTGSCYINPTTTSLSCSSDVRLKTNINSLTASSGIAALLQLNPVTYNWKTEATGSPPHTGFIAQQVLPIFPDLVSQGPDGYYTLNYAGFAPYIVEAVQQMYQQLTSLENTVAGFAQSFTTQTLTFNRATGQQLCLKQSDGSQICVTGDQLAALLSQTASAQTPESVTSSATSPASQNSTPTLPESATSTPASATPPVLQVNGDNPAIIQVGTTYNDLGATITGPQQDLNLGISTFVNGVAVSPVQIDTSTAATDTIEYVASDQSGLTATSTRTVIIEAPANDNQATTTPANDNFPPLVSTSTSATTTAQ
jgi:Chaperone of endosialidase/Domain of unknown function (DUF5011)